MSGGGDAAGLRAVVDHTECFGFAFCAGTLPDVFWLDAEGHAVARDVDADESLLAQAADDCPRGAITIVPRPGDR